MVSDIRFYWRGRLYAFFFKLQFINMSCWVGFVKRHTYKTKENEKSFFISFSSCEIQTGNQCQEAIPTGSGAPSSQEDNSQARAD